jgi:hypothetical protein
MLTIRSFFSTFLLRLSLAVFAVSSGAFPLFTAGFFTMALFSTQPKLKQFASAPTPD